MESNKINIALELYLDRYPDFLHEVNLRMDSNGDVTIKKWNAPEPEPSLADLQHIYDTQGVEWYKKKKRAEIKTNTDKLIVSGFIHNGVNYGSTLIDQTNWNTVLGLKNRVSYPMQNIIKDVNGDYIEVQNQNELEDIVLSGMAKVNTYRESHKTLIDQINACTTIAEVEAIEDNRV